MNAALQPDTVLPAGMHPDEWATRLELAACYRVFAMLGWTEMIYNHITLRLPESVTGAVAGPPQDGSAPSGGSEPRAAGSVGVTSSVAGPPQDGSAPSGGSEPRAAGSVGADAQKQFLINPFGLHYSEVTASNLVKINLKGEVLDGSPHPVNPAGFTVHAAIHDGIEGAHCVMHTHTTAGVAVACLKDGLQQTNFYSAQLHDMVAYHDFEGITIHADEGPRVLQSIGDKPAVILRNHGLLAWGTTLPQTFAILWTLQRACEIQLATFSMGGAQAVIPVTEAVAQKCTRDALQFNPNHGAGRDVFDALVRQVNRIDTSYRD